MNIPSLSINTIRIYNKNIEHIGSSQILSRALNRPINLYRCPFLNESVVSSAWTARRTLGHLELDRTFNWIFARFVDLRCFSSSSPAAILSRRTTADILNPEEGDQNKSALPRLPSGRLGARMDRRVLREGLFLIFVRFSSRQGEMRKPDDGGGGGRRRDTLRHRGDNANRGLETKSENVGLSLFRRRKSADWQFFGSHREKNNATKCTVFSPYKKYSS